MTPTGFLLAVILIQQGFFGLVWGLSAWLRLARRPSVHWGLAALAVAAGLALVLLRRGLDPWLSYFLANVLLVLAFVALRRGLRLFARLPAGDLEQSLVLALVVLGVGAAVGWRAPPYVIATVVSAAVAWTLARAASEVRHGLAVEFGATTARACALPLLAVAVVFAARGLLAPVFRDQVGQSLAADTSFNAVVVSVFVALGLLTNATLAAIVAVRLVRRLEHSSDHDALTGLLNRRGMERILKRESALHERFGQGYALLSLDIDHFKTVNDRHGHAAGDAVLTQVAAALQQVSREVDRVGRVGGEEFCVLLPSTDLIGAEQAARRLLEAVRAMRVDAPGADITVTVSIGVAVSRGRGEPLQDVQRLADRALYVAKARGRDRIELATEGGSPPQVPGVA